MSEFEDVVNALDESTAAADAKMRLLAHEFKNLEQSDSVPDLLRLLIKIHFVEHSARADVVSANPFRPKHKTTTTSIKPPDWALKMAEQTEPDEPVKR